MAKANGILEVHLTFKDLSKKAILELQGKIAKLGATTVEIRDQEPSAKQIGMAPTKIA